MSGRSRGCAGRALGQPGAAFVLRRHPSGSVVLRYSVVSSGESFAVLITFRHLEPDQYFTVADQISF